jgi:multisubunit Na+/H+ antiporter MnhF subunit
VINAAFVLLWLAGALLLVRVVVGPSLADRVVALDGLLIVVICGLAVNAARTDSDLFTDVAVVIGLLGFLGTAVAARFIERRGA